MDTQFRPCKRKILSQANVERQNKSHKINIPQSSKSVSRHKLLIDLVIVNNIIIIRDTYNLMLN